MHRIVIILFDDVVMSDFSTPYDLFRHVLLPDGKPGYQVCFCGPSLVFSSGGLRLEAGKGLRALEKAETIIVPGRDNALAPAPPLLLNALRSAARRGTRIASICTGACVLAQTGLLDGLRATTHWLISEALARNYPAIRVDPNVLYVDNGQILTSAGAAAAHDLCLHLVRQDYGAAVAARTARVAVMPLFREGGQAQFIDRTDSCSEQTSALSLTLEWMQENLHQPVYLADIAQKAAMSPRTLNRRFLEEVGMTPIQWLTQMRVRTAQRLLETTQHSIEIVMAKSGFSSPSVLRKHFKHVVGMSPQAYRRAFKFD